MEHMEDNRSLEVIIKERDQFRSELKEMLEQKTKLQREKDYVSTQLKENTTKSTNKIKELEEALESEVHDKLKLEKQIKVMIDERDKMKLRIVKLKSRKGKVDYGIKMCRNCGKEFPEKENFNWSCRTH